MIGRRRAHACNGLQRCRRSLAGPSCPVTPLWQLPTPIGCNRGPDCYSYLVGDAQEMLINEKPKLTNTDVTPKAVYQNRRTFLRTAGLAAAASIAGREIWEI